MLEIPAKETSIALRRSSGVRYPRGSVGGGAFIEAAVFAGQNRPHFSELKRII
jgi:hypothetical protein